MGVKRIIDLETLGSISEGDYIPVDNETGGTKKYPANALGGSGTDTALRASTAADYDPTRTYEAGEYCLRNGQLYECTTAITQAEAWNASHWTARTVGGQLETLKSDLNSKYEKPSGGIPLSDLASNETTVSGSTPTITGTAGYRYICGECSTLAITAPASGCIDVLFESGSTATVLTVTSAKTGVTAIKWANSFDPTSLDASTVYELNILDGEYGVACKWT